MVTAENEKPARAPLSRQQVLRTALDYVDQHGLEALSMHKLGAALGVKATCLYSDMAAQFRVGVDMMICGLDACLRTIR